MMMDDDIPEHMTKPSFFKVLRDSLALKLKLPTLFAMKHFVENGFPETPVLKTKAGESWVVKISKVGEEQYFFSHGWKKFVTDNKLESGDFIIFWLIDESTFQVAFYDENCCEKELFLSASPDLVEIKGKKRRRSSVNENVETLKGEGKRRKFDPTISNKFTTLSSVYQKIQHESDATAEGNSVNVKDKKEEFFVTAGSDETGKPFFERVVTKSSREQMYIPAKLVREIGICENPIVLRDDEGREWPMEASLIVDGRVALRIGWPKFFDDKKLVPGDSCSFAFLGHDEGNLDDGVQVVKIEVKRTGKLPLKYDSETANRGHPFFQRVIRSSDKYILRLPRKFMIETGLQFCRKTVVRDVKGMDWPIRVRVLRDGRAELSSGWRDILQANHFLVGQTLSLEFIKREDKVVDVIQVKQIEGEKRRERLHRSVATLKGKGEKLKYPSTSTKFASITNTCTKTRAGRNRAGLKSLDNDKNKSDVSLGTPDIAKTSQPAFRKMITRSIIRRTTTKLKYD